MKHTVAGCGWVGRVVMAALWRRFNLILQGSAPIILTRPHITGYLQARFPAAVYMENIQANQQDVRNVLELQITAHKERIETDFRNEILDKIEDSQGM